VEEFLKILTLILISSVKFAFGPSFAYMNQKYDFTWFETNIYSIMGGMMGVIIFMHLSEWIVKVWFQLRVYLFHKKEKRRELFSAPVADIEDEIEIHYQYVDRKMPQKKIFSRRSRRMVKIWKKYGLLGLAALTPVLFSIPIGIFFIGRLEKNRNKIVLYMFISITCWSLIITTFFQLSHARSWHEILK
jgi:uncharacterized membrane protein